MGEGDSIIREFRGSWQKGSLRSSVKKCWDPGMRWPFFGFSPGMKVRPWTKRAQNLAKKESPGLTRGRPGVFRGIH